MKTLKQFFALLIRGGRGVANLTIAILPPHQNLWRGGIKKERRGRRFKAADRRHFWCGSLLILFGITARLVDHPANFAPIAAIALFAGVYLPRKFAFVAPALAMLLSDLFLGFYQWQIMAAVYGSFLLAGLIGLYVRENKKLGTVIAGSLLASILFFLITNFVVWFFYYERSLAGLALAYGLAVPFFRNTMLGDLFFVGALFGSYELAYWLARQKFNKTAQNEYLRS